MKSKLLAVCLLAGLFCLMGLGGEGIAQDAAVEAVETETTEAAADGPSIPMIFLFLSPLWWILVLGASCAIVYFVHEEKGLFATGVLAGSILLMLVFGDMTLTYLWDNIYWVVGCVLGFVGIGALWGCGARWAIFLADVKLKYKEEMLEWLRSKNVQGGSVPDALKPEWREYLLRPESNWSYSTGELIGDEDEYPQRFVREIRIVPSAWDHKMRITRWMAFWPWSMVWQIVDNLIWKVFQRIRVLAAQKMNEMATYWFRGVEDDYTVRPPADDAENVEENDEEPVPAE